MTLQRLAPALAWLWLAGCSSNTANDPPPVFGGEGAQVQNASETPLREGEGELSSGPCAQPSPPSDNPVIEDFEDGDHHLFKVFERDGWWFTATDDTDGKVAPPRDGFKPSGFPEGEATTDNRYAAHLKAEGFTDWGVVWGTTLEWKKEGVTCPFNASQFKGIRFRAKGSGRVRFNFGTLETFPKDNGGNCTQGCYDTHGKVVDLQPTWTVHTIAFDKLQQGGWGKDVRFDPERLLTLAFNANPEAQPVDFWLDDLEWVVDLTEAPPSSVPPTPSATTSAPAASAPAAPSAAPTSTAAPAPAATGAPRPKP